MFADYLSEQLSLLADDYAIEVEVTRSAQEIPFPYVLDGSDGAQMSGVTPQDLAQHFPTTELARIGDGKVGKRVSTQVGPFRLQQIEGGKGGSLELFYLLKTGQNTRKQEQHALAISSSR